MSFNMHDGFGHTYQAHINDRSAQWRVWLSQPFNELLFHGTGLAPTPELGQRIDRMMAFCRNEVLLEDPRERAIALMMQMAWHLEWMATALMGEQTEISDRAAFMAGFKNITAQIHNLDTGVVGPWVHERLQAAEDRFHQSAMEFNALQNPGMWAGDPRMPQMPDGAADSPAGAFGPLVAGAPLPPLPDFDDEPAAGSTVVPLFGRAPAETPTEAVAPTQAPEATPDTDRSA